MIATFKAARSTASSRVGRRMARVLPPVEGGLNSARAQLSPKYPSILLGHGIRKFIELISFTLRPNLVELLVES